MIVLNNNKGIGPDHPKQISLLHMIITLLILCVCYYGIFLRVLATAVIVNVISTCYYTTAVFVKI